MVNGNGNMLYATGSPTGSPSLPWQHLGRDITVAESWQEAIKIAKLDWEVAEVPLYTMWPEHWSLLVQDYKAVVRLDTKQVLGIHGEGYRIFQNADAFAFCDDLLETGATYETAGALGHGKRIWCLARIPQADFEIGKGDKHQMYLLVATSHDGSLSTTVTCTSVRVTCQNTLMAALRNAGDGKLKIKHTKTADERISRARKMIQGTVQTADSLAAKLRLLASTPLKREHVTTIFDRLFPVKRTEDNREISSTRRDNMLAEILASYEVCDGGMFPEQRGTAYALLNAVTDYTDHIRGTRKTNGDSEEYARAESALFGSGAKIKSQALDVIYQTVAGSSGSSILDSMLEVQF